MKNRALQVAPLGMLLAVCFACGTGREPSADTQAGAAKPTPRTADGKPDLSGFWRGPLLRNMDKNVPGGFKAIFTPAGAAAYEHNLTKTINPEGLCLFAGIPRASISGVPFQIVQNANRVAFLYELMWTFDRFRWMGVRYPMLQNPPSSEPVLADGTTIRWSSSRWDSRRSSVGSTTMRIRTATRCA